LRAQDSPSTQRKILGERHQSLIFGSGSRMNRDIFRELSGVAATVNDVPAAGRNPGGLVQAGFATGVTIHAPRRPFLPGRPGRPKTFHGGRKRWGLLEDCDASVAQRCGELPNTRGSACHYDDAGAV
jgi:hypothetical protein